MSDSTIPLKKCPTCGEEKPATLEYFSPRKYKNGKVGLYTYCLLCNRKKAEYQNRKRGHKPLRLAVSNRGTRYCTRCGQEKPVTREFFHYNSRGASGFNSVCIECIKVEGLAKRDAVRARARNYYIANTEKVKQYQREYNKKNQQKVQLRKRLYNATHPAIGRVSANRRRARKQSLPNTWTDRHWNLCLEYWHYCCAVCGAQLRDLFGNVKPNADHWIPLTYKGTDNPGTVPENMICLCGNCNNRKFTKLPVDWLSGFYGNKKTTEILKRIQIYFDWIKQQ